jgi:hypothetical protein
VETDDPPRKVRVKVCGRCTAAAVLEAIARRVACEGRMDDTRTADSANPNVDGRTDGVAGAGSSHVV